MKTADLDYELPEALIAAHPTERRDGARLLILDGDTLRDGRVEDLAHLIPERALLVVNDTRVRRARIFGTRQGSGGRIELLFTRRVALAPAGGDEADGRERWEAIGRASKPLRVGTRIEWEEIRIEVLHKSPEGTLLVAVDAAGADFERVLEQRGHLPLPPYMRRSDEVVDLERYQTVYARRTASAAAPTAGLHFTPELFERLRERHVEIGRLELEIGLATFRAVTALDLDDHPMHAETFALGPELVQAVRAARERNAPIVAVGTTVVRALESAADPARPGEVRASHGETRLLIQPGYRFQVVDALLTNFHVPQSTLLALVSAFAGHDAVMSAYRHAVAARYRFLSYGDAMWIPKRRA
ncbi:MAG TPA: tRNA preQ1(34) S-adenosylmethionine ribosyltransferase-isomerase QueA [Polyangiaceae bacterium]|nr:tRNA preQ1(34) S-adenosylmethionine ribosyltransferase-isomerase QueA [Polyangiaceae bacterium]